jgi:hypothetical protein
VDNLLRRHKGSYRNLVHSIVAGIVAWNTTACCTGLRFGVLEDINYVLFCNQRWNTHGSSRRLGANVVVMYQAHCAHFKRPDNRKDQFMQPLTGSTTPRHHSATLDHSETNLTEDYDNTVADASGFNTFPDLLEIGGDFTTE